MKPEDIKDFTQEQLTDLNILREAFKANTEVEKTVLINAMLARSKELRCYQVVQSLITAIKKDIENQIKENRRKANNRTEFNYPGRDEMDCGSWIADEEGVKILVDYNETTVCYHPIFPLERLFNIETKTEKIKLAYKRDNHWKDITVDKDLIASSSKIVKLAAYGIAVTSENAKGLVKYLSDIENLNEGKISLKTSTSKFGWHGDDFIPFDTKVIFDDESRFKELSDSLRSRGSYEIWLDLTRRIRKNITHNEPQIYLAASFASVLISKLNMLPFIVNLWGSTGKGKTVALMLAASVWADPSEGKYITDSYATQNAFEIRLDILNHLPLMLDDLSKVKDKCDDNFTDLVYLLCSGRGKRAYKACGRGPK